MNPQLEYMLYCVVCDTTMSPTDDDVVCSAECRRTFADFVVICSFNECTNCGKEVLGRETEVGFCSSNCAQTHQHEEYLRTHCLYCDELMKEPVYQEVCGDLCKTKVALDRYLDETEKYVESKRQQHVEED